MKHAPIVIPKEKTMWKRIAAIAAASVGLAAAPAYSGMPQPSTRLSEPVVSDCTSIRARADWDRVRVAEVMFTFVFGDSSSHSQTLVEQPRPSRAGFEEIVLANDSNSPFANGAGSVRADFIDAKGDIAGSDSKPFNLSLCP
jgi:hypothetical protein